MSATNAATTLITFSFPATTWTTSVHLVGDFNGWNPHATPLRQGEDAWEVSIQLRVGQSYRYGYLLDGANWEGAQAYDAAGLCRSCATHVLSVADDATFEDVAHRWDTHTRS